MVSGLYVENVYAMECIESVEALMGPLVLKSFVNEMSVGEMLVQF